MVYDNVFTPYTIHPQIIISNMYSFFCTHYDYGYEFSGETHNFWECVYVFDGSINVSADERVYNLKHGELIFHKPLELHKFYVNHPSGATLLIFSFSAEGSLTDWFQNKVFSLTTAQCEFLTTLISYADSKLHALSESNASINLKNTYALNYYLQPFNLIPHYSQVLCNYFYQLFFSLTEEGTVSTESSAPDALLFRKAVKYMNDNLTCQLSISAIARHCNISDATLKRLFEKYAGISVHKYFIMLKIKISIKLLENGYSVTDVANQLGFANQSYFSKTFKRIVGTPPTQYRKEIHAKLYNSNPFSHTILERSV